MVPRAVPDLVADLAGESTVAAAVDRAREAYAQLRWHPALRRRADEVAAEVAVRAAVSVAALQGARYPVDALRRDRGADGAAVGTPDPARAVAVGALRAILLVGERRPAALGQLLAKLHAVAAAGLVERELLGRPRPGTAPVLTGLVGLVAPAVAPAGLCAGIAHAEIVTADAFAPVSSTVAFALARGIARWGGLDPLGVGLAEAAAAADPAGYRDALREYPADPSRWCRWWLDALATGAEFGAAAADSVAAQRF